MATKASDDRITIRKITDDRRAAWQKAADADGRPLTSWLRHVADLAASQANNGKPARRRRAAA